MAIALQIEVSVHVNGQQLQEFDDNDDDDDCIVMNSEMVTKYIEAISDATFEIGIKISYSYSHTSDAIRFAIFVDGRYVEQVTWQVSNLLACGRDMKYLCKGPRKRDGKGCSMRPFSFCEIIQSKFCSEQ